MNDEEKQKLQQGAEIKLCGQKFPARSHYNLESCVDKRRKEKEQKLLSLFNKKIKIQNENTKKYFERWQNNTRKMSDNEICCIDCGYLKCNGKWCGCF